MDKKTLERGCEILHGKQHVAECIRECKRAELRLTEEMPKGGDGEKYARVEICRYTVHIPEESAKKMLADELKRLEDRARELEKEFEEL